METVHAHARVVIHFHPDRFGTKPIPVAEALLREGVYRNQFETGLSTGGLSAFPGGARDSWERSLFGGAYHTRGVSDSERPKYGALELVRYADGSIPRFGSCYFVLRPSVSVRTSFTFAGSEDPRANERLGMIGQMENVMAALFAEIEAGGMAAPPWPPFRAPTLGLSNLTVARLLEVLRELARPRKEPADLPTGRVLDTQIEAQVHGPLDLQKDVELLVADPAFAPTSIGEVLRQIAARLRIPFALALWISVVCGRDSRRFSWTGDAPPRAAHRRRERDHRCGGDRSRRSIVVPPPRRVGRLGKPRRGASALETALACARALRRSCCPAFLTLLTGCASCSLECIRLPDSVSLPNGTSRSVGFQLALFWSSISRSLTRNGRNNPTHSVSRTAPRRWAVRNPRQTSQSSTSRWLDGGRDWFAFRIDSCIPRQLRCHARASTR